MMKILIVSGFLGAGKTTFIRRLSRNIGKRFVILENEYGATGIDGARLGKDVAEEGECLGNDGAVYLLHPGKRILPLLSSRSPTRWIRNISSWNLRE